MWKMQSLLTSRTNSRQLAYTYWLLFGSPHYNIQSRRLETSVCFAHQSLEHDCHTPADGKHLLNSCRIYECWVYSFSTKDFPVNYDSNSKRIYMQASAWRSGTAYVKNTPTYHGAWRGVGITYQFSFSFSQRKVAFVRSCSTGRCFLHCNLYRSYHLSIQHTQL